MSNLTDGLSQDEDDGCDCDQVFTTQEALDEHRREVQSRTCEQCDRVFAHSRAKDEHFNDVHPDQFWCQYGCDRFFRTYRALSQHNLDKHGYCDSDSSY